MKDELKHRILRKIAETIDYSEIKKDFPDLDQHGIKSFLLELADQFKKEKSANIHIDGASRGNPGEAGVGVLIAATDGRVIKKIARYIGKTTNNEAEYTALLTALEEANGMDIEAVNIFADSELLVKQIKGEYKVKSEGLRPLHKKAQALLMKFRRYDIIHVGRDKNREADMLANQAIDLK